MLAFLIKYKTKERFKKLNKRNCAGWNLKIIKMCLQKQNHVHNLVYF